jgi:hypothetical protein
VIRRHPHRWHFYVRLMDGKYLPVGAFKEVEYDGPQGLIRCNSS